MQTYIIVTGIPASGKSTVGRLLSNALGIAFLDKDEILESMFESRGVGDAGWRTRLSRAADEELQKLALQSRGSVITSWWCHPRSTVDSGTPVEWLASLPGTIIEVHCKCDPHVAAERFMSRKRHEGHLDNLKTQTELLSGFQKQSDFGPLNLGLVVEVNTEKPVELSLILSQLEMLSNGN